MNDHDLITAVRDSFTDVHSDTPVEQIVRRSRTVRARRRVPALTAAVAVVAAAGLAVTWLLPGHSATVQPGIHLTAWTVVKHADGTVYVRINQLRDPGGLQRKLRADGVPASVVFGNPMNVQQKPCQWYHGNHSGLLPKVVPSIAPGQPHRDPGDPPLSPPRWGRGADHHHDQPIQNRRPPGEHQPGVHRQLNPGPSLVHPRPPR